jgi:hypothetical protein
MSIHELLFQDQHYKDTTKCVGLVQTEPVSLTFHSALRKLNTEPSIGASHQISVHFGKALSEKKIFRNRPI